jgi:hypothetical protein
MRQVGAATAFAILAALSKASGWAIFASAAAVLCLASCAAAPQLRRRYAAAAALFIVGFLLVVPMVPPYRQNLAQAGTPFVNDAFKTPVMEREVPRPSDWFVETFFTFRVAELLREPYIGLGDGPYPLHRESLWSQLYGRMLFLRFDRGLWRNLDPALLWLGRVCLVLGLLPLAALWRGTVEVVWATGRGLVARRLTWLAAYQEWQHLVYVAAMLAAMGLLLVQYHRLAILYMWMKAIYLLPAVLPLFALFLHGLQRLWQRAPRLVTAWMLAMVAASVVDLGWLIHDVVRRPAP